MRLKQRGVRPSLIAHGTKYPDVLLVLRPDRSMLSTDKIKVYSQNCFLNWPKVKVLIFFYIKSKFN